MPPRYNDVVRETLVLVQDEKLAHGSFHRWWNDIVQDELVPVEEKLASTGFRPWWNDAIRYALVLVQEGKLAAIMC
jgi:hypothetical protein